MCAFLAVREDKEMAYGYPAAANCCHRRHPPAPVELARQDELCLTPEYLSCPRMLEPFPVPQVRREPRPAPERQTGLTLPFAAEEVRQRVWQQIKRRRVQAQLAGGLVLLLALALLVLSFNSRPATRDPLASAPPSHSVDTASAARAAEDRAAVAVAPSRNAIIAEQAPTVPADRDVEAAAGASTPPAATATAVTGAPSAARDGSAGPDAISPSPEATALIATPATEAPAIEAAPAEEAPPPTPFPTRVLEFPLESGVIFHVFSPYDTLRRLAFVYGTTPEAILQANNLPPDGTLRLGQTVRVALEEPPDLQLAPYTDRAIIRHVVQPGEYMMFYVEHYDTTLEAIRALNPLDGISLVPGRVLFIPANLSSPPPGPPPPPAD